jgi:hypothetical protein
MRIEHHEPQDFPSGEFQDTLCTPAFARGLIHVAPRHHLAANISAKHRPRRRTTAAQIADDARGAAARSRSANRLPPKCCGPLKTYAKDYDAGAVVAAIEPP